MPDPSLSMSTTFDDDLPRTVRRERDAREREAREREARERETRERGAREREAREASERAQRDRDREREREREAAAAGPSFGPAQGSGLSSGMGSAMGPATSMPHPHGGMHAPQPMRMDHDDADLPAPPATVTAFDVPFVNLMFFFLKAVLAGVPALLLMGAILWGFGHVLQTFFPALLKLKIMIYVPQL